MMLHIDGSTHQWFGDERWFDLIVILDDATSEIYRARIDDDGRRLKISTLPQTIQLEVSKNPSKIASKNTHFYCTSLLSIWPATKLMFIDHDVRERPVNDLP